MSKIAKLRTTLDTLHAIERGLTSYVVAGDGPCHLLLADDSAVRGSPVATDVAPRFECFSLALTADKAPTGCVNAFTIPKDGAILSVLVREEYIEPFTGDPSDLVGQNPTTQIAAMPGHVPERALASYVVAYGILIEGVQDRLAVIADWFPFKIEATTGEARITALLGESEAVSIARYARLYGFS